MNKPDPHGPAEHRTLHRAEHTRELAATPEHVWNAIATAEGISTWMVPTRMTPKIGGEISFDHGGFRSTGVITDYTPNERFAYDEPWPMTDEMREWVADTAGHEVTADELALISPVATEFLIEAVAGGSCILRVVTSAYGSGADWENEYFSEMAAGWGTVPFGPDHRKPWLDNLVEQLDATGVPTSDPRADGRDPAITVTPILVAELSVEGEVMPVCVHVIDHPNGRVLVDTGMTELHPAVVDAFDPRLYPLDRQDFDVASIDIIVNTHLHADHCGGNHLFAGRPIYVQRRELDDARTHDAYTIREWVDAPGMQYVPVDGDLELLPGIRLVAAPGHTDGSQIVVIETGGRPTVICGDSAVWFGELDEPRTEAQRLIRSLDPDGVWLAHVREPWRPGAQPPPPPELGR